MRLDERPTIKSKKDKVQKNFYHFLKTTNFKFFETTSYQLGSLGRQCCEAFKTCRYPQYVGRMQNKQRQLGQPINVIIWKGNAKFNSE